MTTVIVAASVALAALLGTALCVALYRRAERRVAAPPLDSACLYLDENQVLEHYRQLSRDVQREVEKTVRRAGRVRLEPPSAPGSGAGAEHSEQLVVKALESDQPMAVLQPVIRSLQERGRLVHVDLETLRMRLDRQAARYFPEPVERLSELALDQYVVLTGRFEVSEKDGRPEALEGVLGPHPSGEAMARVKVDGPFRRKAGTRLRARCVGRVQEWDAKHGILVVDPVLAIFH